MFGVERTRIIELPCKKVSVVWGGADYLGFDNILSTIIVYLLLILTNVNIHVSNRILLLSVNSFGNCNFLETV